MFKLPDSLTLSILSEWKRLHSTPSPKFLKIAQHAILLVGALFADCLYVPLVFLAKKLKKMHRKTCYVLCCEGVNEESAASLKRICETYCRGLQVEFIDAEGIRGNVWKERAQLLVLPGGKFSPMQKALQEEGLKNIVSFVNECAGNVLAVCAGAYGMSQWSCFDGHKKKRDYYLAPIEARGPIFQTTSEYQSWENFRAVDIQTSECKGHAYYLAGPTFTRLDQDDDHMVSLASYEGCLGDAVVSYRESNKGKVVLSGIHLEYILDIKNNNYSDERIRRSFEKIKESESFHTQLWGRIFRELDLR